MSYKSLIARIDNALEESHQRKLPHVTVPVRDLQWLLSNFKAMDARERMHYPGHIEMMTAAATKAVRELSEALDRSRPDWREKT